MERELAAQIYLATKDKGWNVVSVLKLIKLTKDADIDKIISEYEKIIEGNLQIVHIISSEVLNDGEKQKITDKIANQFSKSKFVFAYTVDKTVPFGLEIWIADNKLELTV